MQPSCYLSRNLQQVYASTGILQLVRVAELLSRLLTASFFALLQVDLFDDMADGITYCNHFFAPMDMSLYDLAGVYRAYAKYHHDRADMFVMLARAISEDKILEMNDADASYTVSSLLKAFDTFEFWPDATEGLFVVADIKRPEAFTPAQKADITSYIAKVRERLKPMLLAAAAAVCRLLGCVICPEPSLASLFHLMISSLHAAPPSKVPPLFFGHWSIDC